MAGSMDSVKQQLRSEAMAMCAIVGQWEVQYAGFVRFPLSKADSAHQQLSINWRKRKGGVWMCTSASVTSKSNAAGISGDASLKLIADCSGDASLNLSVRWKVLEEHRISKLNFTWPHVSCVSGFPARGARVVFVSYKDSFGQVQKFALRFLTTVEAERFINVLKETMDAQYGDEGCNSDSRLSSQSEFVPSTEPPYKSVNRSMAEENWRNTTSADTSTYQVTENLSHEVDRTVALEAKQGREFEDVLSDFPPSFTSFLRNCCPPSEKVNPQTATAQPSILEEVDLRAQVTRYLEDSSFQDLLIKVEGIISDMGYSEVL